MSLSNICFHLLRQFISTTAVVRNKKLSSRLQPFLIKMNTFTRNQSTGTHEMHVHRQGNMYSVMWEMIEWWILLTTSTSLHLAKLFMAYLSLNWIKNCKNLVCSNNLLHIASLQIILHSHLKQRVRQLLCHNSLGSSI